MADPVINQFEIERRVITWSPLTTLNDGITPLGYNGDPNLVSPVGTPGEQWLYSIPIGQFYKQTDATLWWKSGAPNTGINLVTGGGGGTVEGAYSGPAVSVADAVYVVAAAAVAPANAGTIGPNRSIGICVAKPTPTTATVQFAGEAAVFSGTLTAGATYFLDKVSGQITSSVATFVIVDSVQDVGVSKDTKKQVINQQFLTIL